VSVIKKYDYPDVRVIEGIVIATLLQLTASTLIADVLTQIEPAHPFMWKLKIRLTSEI